MGSLVVTSAAESSGLEFLPARFGEGPESVQATIKCPSIPPHEKLIGVFCQAEVGVDGSPHFARSFCFSNFPANDAYVRAARHAIRESRFIPASVDGTPVRVNFSFRIIFSGKNRACRTVVLPNFGFQSESFGLAYHAPQELLTGINWYTRSGRLGRENDRILAATRGIVFSMSVAVSQEGEANDARLETNNFGKTREVNRGLAALGKSRFIPGFYEGRPQAMRYYEVLYRAPP